MFCFPISNVAIEKYVNPTLFPTHVSFRICFSLQKCLFMLGDLKVLSGVLREDLMFFSHSARPQCAHLNAGSLPLSCGGLSSISFKQMLSSIFFFGSYHQIDFETSGSIFVSGSIYLFSIVFPLCLFVLVLRKFFCSLFWVIIFGA